VRPMKRDYSKQMSKIIDEVLEALRNRLIDEVKYAGCPICKKKILADHGFLEVRLAWANGHVPYYSIEGGRIEVGFHCPRSENPVVVYRISLDALIEALEGGEEGTKYLE